MMDRPLFGEGSAKPKTQKRPNSFLRAQQPAQPVRPVYGQAPGAAIVQPQVAQPQAIQPQVSQPQTVHPQVSQPQAVQPQMAQPPVVAQPSQAEPAYSREHTRMRTLKGGIILVPGQTMATFGCKIRNESAGGAMLKVSANAPLPNQFYLVRDSDPGHKMPCEVAWRTMDRIGVKFISELTAASSQPIG